MVTMLASTVNVNGFPMNENIGKIPEHLNGNVDDSDDVLEMIEDNISPVEVSKISSKQD